MKNQFRWQSLGVPLCLLVAVFLVPIAESRSERHLAFSLMGSLSESVQASLKEKGLEPLIALRAGETQSSLSTWEDFLATESQRAEPRLVLKEESPNILEILDTRDGHFLEVHVKLFTKDPAGMEKPVLEKSERKRVGDRYSLLPPVVAVVLALLTQNILLSLFVAVWTGVCLFHESNPLTGLYLTLIDVLLPVVSDSFNLRILGFTFALVGMVSIVTRMGGTRGLIDRISGRANTPRSAQVATGLMGLVIFFDDYANTVVVGTAARKLTDAMRVSREKLAYIVDSTSAPIAGIALVSTWIGYEVGLFGAILPELNRVEGLPREGYGLFFEALPLRFYCIFALALVFLSAWMNRDMGAMFRAERRARRGDGVLPATASQDADSEADLEKPGVPARWWNAAIPILSVLAGTLGAIAWTGGEPEFTLWSGADWRNAFANAEDAIPTILFVSALAGGALACALSLGQGLLTWKEAGQAYGSSMLHLASAGAILILAWAIKLVCDDIGTGNALIALIGDRIPPVLLPLMVFVLSGVVAFFTGTSWGTMALILPVAAPLAAGLSGEMVIVVASIGAVLDGAIWGDHCSPISDTTVLSSTATGCPHVEHVRTQLPYALLAMTAAGSAGYLGISAGLPLWLCYGLGFLVLAGGLRLFGANPDEGTAP